MFREGAKMAVDQRLDETVIGVINERIRNVFDHQVKACKDNRLPVDVRYAKKESRRRQRMRSAVSIQTHNSDKITYHFFYRNVQCAKNGSTLHLSTCLLATEQKKNVMPCFSWSTSRMKKEWLTLSQPSQVSTCVCRFLLDDPKK